MDCTFVELKSFRRDIDSMQDGSQLLREVQGVILEDPLAGALVKGTNGIRKIRVPGKGKGKSGGFRVWYLNVAETSKIYLLAIYSKGEKADLSDAEAKQLGELVSQLKKESLR